MLTCDKNPYLFQLPMHRLATWLLHFVPTPYPGSHETAGSNAEQNFYDSKTRLGSLLYPNVQLYSPNGSITHSLVDLPRWGLMTAGDHSDIFLLHCARSCDITFSWTYSQPVHSSILYIFIHHQDGSTVDIRRLNTRKSAIADKPLDAVL